MQIQVQSQSERAWPCPSHQELKTVTPLALSVVSPPAPLWQLGFSVVCRRVSIGCSEDGQQDFLCPSPTVLCTSDFYYAAQAGFELAILLCLPP